MNLRNWTFEGLSSAAMLSASAALSLLFLLTYAAAPAQRPDHESTPVAMALLMGFIILPVIAAVYGILGMVLGLVFVSFRRRAISRWVSDAVGVLALSLIIYALFSVRVSATTLAAWNLIVIVVDGILLYVFTNRRLKFW